MSSAFDTVQRGTTGALQFTAYSIASRLRLQYTMDGKDAWDFFPAVGTLHGGEMEES